MRETLARQLVAHAPRVVWRGAALPALVAGGSAVRLMATFVSEKPTASRCAAPGIVSSVAGQEAEAGGGSGRRVRDASLG